ncbi:hypothetical protein EF910_00450 [Streptomyces sp. WAC07149]|uniref:hypothetical protein n=1 Tax=Streptomyces sp. WAC07149 TaxID=2487425 RepID=UPI000F796505|nr:hypothetical protein [Streptomyces sp. WAC07149]RST08752.1 hypothetical protein EF910_00450 [Streptomyces sp. WAC07149]
MTGGPGGVGPAAEAESGAESDRGSGPVVYALVAGAGEFPRLLPDEAERAEGTARLGPLPSVGPAVRELATALARAGVRTGGDPLLEPDRARLRARWEELRGAGEGGDCEGGEGEGGEGEDGGQGAGAGASPDALILHFAGHGLRGAAGGLYLAPAGADPSRGRIDATCVSVRALLDEAENGELPVLFLLDVCGAGQAVAEQQLQDLAARREQDGVRNAWVIGAATADAAAYGARFTAATAAVLHRLVSGTLDLDPVLAYVPVDALALAVERELGHAAAEAGLPRPTVVRTPSVAASTEPEPFLRNPAHTGDPRTALLAGMDGRLRDFALTCAPGLDPLHFATRAAGNPAARVFQFSGRTAQLARIEEFLRPASGGGAGAGAGAEGRAGRRAGSPVSPLLVVTGSPGSGKSALLGVTVCLAHPELAPLLPAVLPAVGDFDPEVPGPVLAVHARRLTGAQAAASLLHQLARQTGRAPVPCPPGEEVATLLGELAAAESALVVLDALDEAQEPEAVVNRLLLPLVRAAEAHPVPGAVKVLVGTRPWWETFPELHAYAGGRGDVLLELDPVTEEDRLLLAGDLASYLRKLLVQRYSRTEIRRIADRLAARAEGGAFLVAALYADHLLTTGGDAAAEPPSGIGEVFDMDLRRLAAGDPWIEPVLQAVGHALGQGMPLTLVHAVALAHRPPGPGRPTPQLADTRRALETAAFYLRTAADTDHTVLYRFFHQALADRTAPAIRAGAVADAIRAAASPPGPDGGAAFTLPYAERHLDQYAVREQLDSRSEIIRLFEKLRRKG